MTLLLGMVNPMHAVVISDRRLTVNGRLLDDESAKMFALACLDARVAFAYTGLAAPREFETRPWLLRTMMDAATHDPHLQPMFDYLRTVATATFANLGFPDKRLSVMCVGYRYDEGLTHEIMAMVSNYDGFGRSPGSVAASEFTLEYSVDGPSVAAGNVLGAQLRLTILSRCKSCCAANRYRHLHWSGRVSRRSEARRTDRVHAA